MKRILLGLLGVVVLLLIAMVLRVATLESRQPVAAESVAIDVDVEATASRFSRALTYPTISHQDPADGEPEVFLAFHDFLAEAFPLTHETLVRETVSDLSLLFTWEGSDGSLDPVVLMGHMDVVPVIPGTEQDWLQPPFSGAIADGEIWGRGALDNKSSVMAVLEAVEILVSEGFRPRRTIYLAFGHDEEVGGMDGAARIAALLAERGAEPYALVLDEGGFIAEGIAEGIEGLAAFVGIAEKGFVSHELLVRGKGGHSSAPPDHTSLGVLSRAVTRLEGDQFPARIDGATEEMIEFLAPEMPFLPRLLMGNLWLTRPLLARMAVLDPSGAAMVRTTTAVTIMNGGVKENVLPIDARAVVNHRILPGETVATVTERVRRVIDDERVQIELLAFRSDPSPVSDTSSPAFELLGRTARQVLDQEFVWLPYLVIGGTDSRYYSGRSDNVFRLLPVVVVDDLRTMVHGTNERIGVEALAQAVRYFVQLVRNTDDLP